MRVLIVGTGYVGLVTGVCMASHGHTVLCVDSNLQRISQFQQGQCPIYEDGLGDMMNEQIAHDRLRFAPEIPDQADYDVAFIAVGTPSQPDGSANLDNVYSVAQCLGERLRQGAVVATKSTVPVGTGDRLEWMLRSMGRTDLFVASVPEFLREGTAVQDTLAPSRLVFGVSDVRTAEVLRDLHASISAPVLLCSRATAEMVKYAANAFLATKISFINEIANICARVGADVSQVASGMGLDPRIGNSFLRAGLGYGGSCFPKDTRALVNIAGDVHYDFKLLKAVVEVNQVQRMAPVEQLKAWFGNLVDKRIAIFGIAFKPGTDDIRESPARDISLAIVAEGAEVQFYDPVVKHFPVNEHTVWDVLQDPYQAVRGCDAVIVVTEWAEIVGLDWGVAQRLMRHSYVFDGRNVLNPDTMEAHGFVFANVGRTSRFSTVPV